MKRSDVFSLASSIVLLIVVLALLTTVMLNGVKWEVVLLLVLLVIGAFDFAITMKHILNDKVITIFKYKEKEK